MQKEVVKEIVFTLGEAASLANERLRNWIKNELNYVCSKVMPKELKELEKEVEALLEQLKELKHKITASKDSVLKIRTKIGSKIADYEEQIRDFEKTLETITDKKLKEQIRKTLDEIKKKIKKAKELYFTAVERIAKDQFPKRLEKVCSNIQKTIKKMLRKEIKIESKRAVALDENNEPIFVYYLILKGCPKVNEKSGTVYIMFRFTKDGVDVDADTRMIAPTHIEGYHLSVVNHKSLSYLGLKKAMQIGFLPAKPNKIIEKPKISAFTKRGFDKKGLNIKIDKKTGSIIVKYKIGSHRDAEKGDDVITKANKKEPASWLLSKMNEAIREAFSLKGPVFPFEDDITKGGVLNWKFDEKGKSFIFEFRFLPYPRK